jgi:hypothetical protein
MDEETRGIYEDVSWMHNLIVDLLEMCRFGETLMFG